MLIAYYEECLGLIPVYREEETWKWGKDIVTFQICKLAAPGQEDTGPYLELVQGRWGTHVSFSVDDWPESVTLAEPFRVGGHIEDIEVKFCMDVCGNMVELVKEKK